jgi:hypothetical protein
VNTTGRLKGLRVTSDGTGIVSHAGVVLLRALADKTGLTAGLSEALASRRRLCMTGAGCRRADCPDRVRGVNIVRYPEGRYGSCPDSLPGGRWKHGS